MKSDFADFAGFHPLFVDLSAAGAAGAAGAQAGGLQDGRSVQLGNRIACNKSEECFCASVWAFSISGAEILSA